MLTNWVMDEHRIGLKPIIFTIQDIQYRNLQVKMQIRYQWRYFYEFLCLESGEILWIILPRFSIAALNEALTEFAKEVGSG